MKRVTLVVLALVIGIFFCRGAQAASVTVSPDSFASDYRGWVTVSVSGIPSGATAVVETILDYDGDGTVGSEDLCFMYNEVQDGVASANSDAITVADGDGLENGTILARLNFWTANRPASKYIFRASGTWGTFSDTGELTQTPTGQSISGVLVNSTGQAISGVVVAWDEQDEKSFYVATDSEGAYTVHLPSAKRYFVVGVFFGMLAEGGKGMVPVDLKAGEHKKDVEIRMSEPTIYVTGRAYDAGTGSGIEHAFIMGEGEGDTPWISRTATDSNGSFSLPVLEGEAEIFVDEENIAGRGYCGALELDTDVPSTGMSSVDFPVRKVESFITGKVYWTGTGIGEPGVCIWGERDDYESSTYTVDGGRYALGVVPGYWSVNVDDEEYPSDALLPAPYQDVLVNQGSTVSGIDFALEVVSATVNVTVVDSGQSPISDIWVWMSDSGGDYRGGANTDVSGQASLGLSAGCYQIGLDNNDLAELGYAQVLSREVCVVTGEIRDITFTVSTGYEVSGTVKVASGGAPIDSAWVEAFDGNQAWDFKYGTNTLSDGTFTMIVPDGAYRFRANKTGYISEFYDEQNDDWYSGDTVLVTPQTAPLSDIDFTLDVSATLRGTVLRSDTDDPVTTAQYYVYDVPGNTVTQGSVSASDGTFSVELSPGNYRVKVEPHLSDMTGFNGSYYYDGKDSLQEADTIALTAGVTTDITVWIRPISQNSLNPDVNGDGFVDGADLLLVQKYWNQNWPQN